MPEDVLDVGVEGGGDVGGSLMAGDGCRETGNNDGDSLGPVYLGFVKAGEARPRMLEAAVV
jgi:hypothetical protein